MQRWCSTISTPSGSAWKAPDQHAYKVNFDRATFVKEELVGLGVVIHNDQGLIMASITQQIPLPSSIIEVEVLAAQRALVHTLELGFKNITLERDFEVLINSLATSCNSLAYCENVMDISFLFILTF